MQTCCRCHGNLGTPDVLFIACIAGRNVVIYCECSCHTSHRSNRGGPVDV